MQVYYTLLLYLIQQQATNHAIQTYAILTNTHDKLSGWAGLGSAVSTLHKQLMLPVSLSGTLLICLYLLSVSMLQITTPALASVQAFNSTVVSVVNTTGIPERGVNDTNMNSTLDFFQNSAGFLPWLEHLEVSQTLGFANGSLYDVLMEAYPGGGIAQVSAVGFNVTCGSISKVVVHHDIFKEKFNFSLPSVSDSYCELPTPGNDPTLY